MAQARPSGRLRRSLGRLIPAVAAGLLAVPPTATPAGKAPPADLALIPANAAVVLGLRPADLWGGEFAKPVRDKVPEDMAAASAEIQRLVGAPAEQIERLVITVLGFGEGAAVAVVRLKEPWGRAALVKRIAGDSAKGESYRGRTLYVRGQGDAVCVLDGQTYVIAKADPLRSLLDVQGTKPDGPLAAAREALAAGHDLVLGLNVPALLDQLGADLPGELEPLKPLLQGKSMVLTADAGTPTRAELALTFADAAAARKADQAFRRAEDLAGLALSAGWIALNEQPGALWLLGLARAVMGGVKTHADRVVTKTTVAGVTLKAQTVARIDAVALAETLRKPYLSRARQTSQQNLKRIALALHNYHGAYGRFPAAANYDPSGKPLLSWRVLLLPFLEQGALYRQFHLDEPWDSAHNKTLLDKMPSVYQDPTQDKPTPRTIYQGFHGRGAFFEGKKGIRQADLTDGKSYTIMIAEAAEAVPWTKPQDLPYDPDKALPRLGGLFEGGFNVAMCDASARFVSTKVKPATLHLIIQRNDGQANPNDF